MIGVFSFAFHDGKTEDRNAFRHLDTETHPWVITALFGCRYLAGHGLFQRCRAGGSLTYKGQSGPAWRGEPGGCSESLTNNEVFCNVSLQGQVDK